MPTQLANVSCPKIIYQSRARIHQRPALLVRSSAAPTYGVPYTLYTVFMTELTDYPNRKRNRLSGFDYSTPGYYFITLCTHNHVQRLATIEDNHVHLEIEGEICKKVWQKLPEWFPCVELDEFIIMPNHIHGILVIKDLQETRSLSTIMGTFKSAVSRRYTNWCKQHHAIKNGPFWQRSFHDHIIRNERALFAIRRYIRYNPQNWEKDPDNL